MQRERQSRNCSFTTTTASMDSSWDTIIVGAGIAGACAAIYCSRRGRTLIIEAEQPASGASGAAAGLVNPFMGRRARPVWRWSQALDALSGTLELGRADKFFSRTGIVRIPRNESQAETYRERHEEFPALTGWLTRDRAEDRYPALEAPHGALRIDAGGVVDVPGLVRRLLETAKEHGAHLLCPAEVTAWESREQHPYVTVDHHTRLYARRIILALGAGYRRFDALRKLDLRGVKGQTVTVECPSALGEIPATSGYGYIAPVGSRLVLGSTYEHDFSSDQPSRRQSRAIIEKVSQMIPGLAQANIIEERAGIRVMTPQTNKAMVGPLPGAENPWFFGGLGSKGLLMAPMMARRLPEWLADPGAIPALLRPDSTRTTQ